MSILRRKRGQPGPVRGPVTLQLHPTSRNGSTSRHHKITVSSYTDDAPKVTIGIQDQTMAAGATLDEDQVGLLVKGLLDALEASKAQRGR